MNYSKFKQIRMKKDLIRFIVVIALMLLFAILCGNKASAQDKSSTHAKPPVERAFDFLGVPKEPTN